MSEIQKMNLASENLVDDRLDKLRELMPEVFTESGIDFDKLRLELGDEVDEGQERYAFTWPGKADAIRQSQTVSTATLRPCPEKSRGRDGEDGSFDSDNIYIEGDNLEVPKLLQRGYHGKVKMIYIDPPYNTGHDFVYHDSFGDTIENYKEQAGLANQSNADTSGRYHSDWCSMMYPRLKLARELLSDDGVIFISIDDNEMGNLKSLCSEIMGARNYVSEIAWQCLDTVKNDAKYFSDNHEYILVYAKNKEDLLIRGIMKGEKQRAYYKNYDNDPRGDYLLTPLHAKSGSESSIYTFTFGNGQSWTPPTGTFPRYSIQTLEKLQREGRLYLDPAGRKTPQKKTYLSEVGDRMPPTSFWDYSTFGSTRQSNAELSAIGLKGMFQNTKPTRMLKTLIDLVDGGDESIVLDFFSGSASTADAIMQLNEKPGIKQRYIMVQLPEVCGEKTDAFRAGYRTICEIGEERIRRAGDKIKTELEESNRQLKLDEEPKELPDIGFRVFTLDDSGIERPEPGQLVLDVVKSDRTELDIVFEMMLKWGLELTLPVEKSEAAGYPIWSVACDELVCCMNRGLTIEALEAIAAMEPRRVLILDSVLDDTLKLNAVQVFKHAGERMGCEIELRTV